MNIEKEIQAYKSKVKNLSYRDVLVNNNKKETKFWHMSEFAKVANELGYQFLLWNNSVYQKEDNGCWMRTPWTEINIH